MSTAQVNRFLLFRAAEASVDVSWTWHHLDRALEREMVKAGRVPGQGHDAAGVMEWLHGRAMNHGLFSAFDTDDEGRLTRVYYIVDGAAEVWKRSVGMSIALFDMTHSTNQYDMRLGCFTTTNEDGRTALLAVSLVKREDARSFSWVFEKFKESFATAPDVLVTDGDLAMAVAAKAVFPGSRHLLCTWHISQNLYEHAVKLFRPAGGTGARPDENCARRKAFILAFMDIMTCGGPGLETPDAYFEAQWNALMEKARVPGATPCPVSVDVNNTAAHEAAYESAAEELDDKLVDGDVEIKVHKRGRGRPKKSPAEQVWEWLSTMKTTKEKWARVFTREVRSRGIFTSNIAESWHGVLKRHLGNQRKLLPLVMHLDLQRKMMDGAKAVKKSVRIREHNATRATHPPLLETLRASISPGAFDYLMDEYKRAVAMSALAVTDVPGPAQYHVCIGRSIAPVVATLRTCSARCHVNRGLPCRHILRVHMAENSEHLDEDLIHNFWRTVDVREYESTSEYEDAVDFGWETGEVAETPADGDLSVPPRDQRYRSIMHMCKGLCEVGKRNKDAYRDLVAAAERLHLDMDRKYSTPVGRLDEGGVNPCTGERVYNPSQPQKGRGRTQAKRRRGPLGV